MILNGNTEFVAILVANDARTGYRRGTRIYPKGVYFQGKNVILVGDKREGHTSRLSLPAANVRVEAQ